MAEPTSDARVPEPASRRTKVAAAGVGALAVVAGLLVVVRSTGTVEQAMTTSTSSTIATLGSSAEAGPTSSTGPTSTAKTPVAPGGRTGSPSGTILVPLAVPAPALPTTTLDPALYQGGSVAGTGAGDGTDGVPSTTTDPLPAPTPSTTLPAPGYSGGPTATTSVAPTTVRGQLVLTAGDDLVRLQAGGATATIGNGRRPALHPDGNRLAFDWSGTVWETSLQAPGTVVPLLGNANTPTWSPDGRTLVVSRSTAVGEELWVLMPGSPTAAAPAVLAGVAGTFAASTGASFAPDGRRIAFAGGSTRGRATALGIADVTAPTSAPSVLVADDGATYGAPAWSPSGAAIAVVVTVGQTSRLDVLDLTNRTVRSLPVDNPTGRPAWATDGRSIAVVTTAADGATSLVVVGVDDATTEVVLGSTVSLADPTWR